MIWLEASEAEPPNLDREELTIGLDEASAETEPLLRTTGPAVRMDEIDGRKVPAAEALEAIAPELAAATELPALLFLSDGPRRAIPRAPEEA